MNSASTQPPSDTSCYSSCPGGKKKNLLWTWLLCGCLRYISIPQSLPVCCFFHRFLIACQADQRNLCVWLCKGWHPTKAAGGTRCCRYPLNFLSDFCVFDLIFNLLRQQKDSALYWKWTQLTKHWDEDKSPYILSPVSGRHTFKDACRTCCVTIPQKKCPGMRSNELLMTFVFFFGVQACLYQTLSFKDTSCPCEKTDMLFVYSSCFLWTSAWKPTKIGAILVGFKVRNSNWPSISWLNVFFTIAGVVECAKMT